MEQNSTNTVKNYKRRRARWLCLFALLCLLGMAHAPDAQAQTYGGGTGTATDPYLISTKAHLAEMTNNRTQWGVGTDVIYYFKLTADINAGGGKLCIGPEEVWISGFVFDGNGHTISNFNNTYSYQVGTGEGMKGLFCAISDVTIKNLTVKDFTVDANRYLGGLVGSINRGTIENCHVENGKLIGRRNSNSNIDPSIIGGLVGYVNGNVIIKGCSVAKNVVIYICDANSTNNIYTASLEIHAGGLVGRTLSDSLTISDCLVATDLVTYISDNHKRVGGIIGSIDSGIAITNIYRVVLPWDNVLNPSTTYQRGRLTGRASGTANARHCYLASSTSVLYGTGVLTTSYISILPSSTNQKWVYDNLETLIYPSETGSSNDPTANQKWGFGNGAKYGVNRNIPLATGFNYLVSINTNYSDLRISNSNVLAFGDANNPSYYAPANTNLSAYLTPSHDAHTKTELEYKYNYNSEKSEIIEFPLGTGSHNFTFQVNKNGSIVRTSTYFPYPITLTSIFNQWENKLTLSWTAQNFDQLVGEWYIYKREKGTSGAWTRSSGGNIITTTEEESYVQAITLATADFDKEWDYTVSFFRDSETIPNSPRLTSGANITVNPTVSIDIAEFVAEGGKSEVTLTALVPTNLINSSSYSYTIARSTDKVSFTDIVSNQQFDGSGKIIYSDKDFKTSCEKYYYRISISAFGRTFDAITANPATITGQSSLLSLYATKGEYSNQVRLEWETKKNNESEINRYKIYRRVARKGENNDNTWVELSTINTAETNYIYTDDKSMPGVFYDYKVTLFQMCESSSTELESLEDIGFSQSLGTVSGRVTYGSGIAVENVNVSVVRNDLQSNESQYHSLKSTGSGFTFSWEPTATYYNAIINGAFTYQFWLNPTIAMTGEVKVGELGNFANLYLVEGANNRYTMRIKNPAGNITYLTTTTGILPGRFSHIVIVRNGTALTCHIVNDEDLANIELKTTTVTHSIGTISATINMGVRMGYDLNGYIDECRLWTRALTEAEIKRDYNRILTGGEEYLKAYWTFDEGLDGRDNQKGYFFDLSRVGTVFNGNHGRHALTSDIVVPTKDQLALKAITDSNGNYQIRGIPFSGEGTSYDIVPSMGIHQFNPTSQLRYISNSSLVHNSTDFTDVSSFPVSGRITYANSNYPVDEVQIYVDGAAASLDGELVTTNAAGEYTVDVPIGSHFITAVKNGHTFVNGGRFPKEELKKHNFQTSLNDIHFQDNTTVRVVGRVVGGQPQTDHPLGFGLSEANIGKATIRLETVNDTYRLNTTDADSVTYNSIDGEQSVTTFKRSIAGSVIEIETNPVTGEFLALLPPVPYDVKGVKTHDFEDTGASGDPIDFYYSKQFLDVNPLNEITVEYRDSIGIMHTFLSHDSLRITRYNDPLIGVRDLAAAAGAFGDAIYNYVDNAVKDNSRDIPLYTVNPDESVTYALGYPAFYQGTAKYKWEISAYEEYVNNDDPDNITTQKVPLADTEIGIDNGLASLSIEVDTTDEENPEYTLTSWVGGVVLDEEGKATYTFNTGFPKLSGDNLLAVQISLAKNGKTFYWENPVNPGEDFQAYLLGMVPVDGNNFVTQGPDHVDIVLHDPPGSSSYAWIEKGSTTASEVKTTFQFDTNEEMSATVYLGPTLVTSVGFGVSIQTEYEFIGEITGGMQWAQSDMTGTSSVTTTTFNQQISTSSDPDYVGAMADVYIGKGTNRIFSKQRNLALYPSAEAPAGTTTGTGDFRLFTKEVTAVGQTFSTAFTYTQDYIIHTMIPNLKQLRNDKIQAVEVIPNYASLTFDSDKNPLYFSTKQKSDPDFGEDKTYAVFFADNAPTNKRIDEVADYNLWIANWEDRIADNEQDKVNLFNKRAALETNNSMQNRSFDSGVNVSESTTESFEETTLSTFMHSFGGYNEDALGLRINGLGLEGHVLFSRDNIWEDENNETKANELTFGFMLSEEGGNSISTTTTDALSVDIYKPSGTEMAKAVELDGEIRNLHGYMFKRRAGQTSCPYEGEERTLYYKEGEHVLNEATFKIENPDLYIDGAKTASTANVPSGREATFILELQNQSEANLPVTYQLKVDELTNANGLILSIDGTPLTNPRNYLIPYGTPVIKTLKARQSSQDILDYENIKLLLASGCDNDIYSEVSFSVTFTQSSSPVSLTASNTVANRAVLDEGGKITFNISGYERNFRNFGCIRLRYKSENSDSWSTIKEFVNDTALYPLNDSNEEITGSTISYDYFFKENEPTDGVYIFQAFAVSKIGTDEVTSASEEIRVVKDVMAPQLLGNATPVNGILAVGDDISLTFNEEIQSGKITIDKFSVTGVLNAKERSEPTAGLSFSGDNKAYTELPIYMNGSFTIESWIKMPQLKAGTLFAFGESDNYFSLGVDDAGHAVVTIGNESQTSAGAIEASEVWKYIGVSYNRTDNTVYVYCSEEAADLELFTAKAFTTVAPVQGKLYVGNNAAGDAGYTGAVSFLHLYNTGRTITDAKSKYETKSGTEPNLIGLWELEEGEGNLSRDKARNRNLILDTDWYIYPLGKALAFDGTDQYARFESGHFPFPSYNDFTWEFRFRGGAQDAATLLSVGTTAYIGFNANHQLILSTASGKTQVLSSANLLDDQWHHFALSAKRNGSTNVYVDGKSVASFNSSIFEGSVGGGYYYLGAKYTEPEGLSMETSEYFNGYIDEVRVWNSALTSNRIALDKNHKLRGTEAGLKAYYPFESYMKLDKTVEVYESLADHAAGSGITIESGGAISDTAAALQDVRPVDNVGFTYVASSNKIVLNLTEEDYVMDGVTLSITAKDILDMNDNPSGTFTWTAYVNRNPLSWVTDAVDVITEYGDTRSFKATIMNSAGTTTDYYIEGLPSWLSVNAASGTLQPLASKELTFTVYEGTNIGNYEASVVLTGVNNIRKILPVTLKVTGIQPDWSVDLGDFEQTMTVTGQVQIEGAPQEDEADILAAFIDELCVGIVSPRYESSYNAYFTYMTIGGNNEHNGKEISFKLWDASTGNVYPMIESSLAGSPLTIAFAGDGSYGTPDEPVVFDAIDVVEQSIALSNGWNWISMNVHNDNLPLIDQFKANATDYATQIKAGDGNYLNNVNDSWLGSIASLAVDQMYMVKTNRTATLHIMGKPVNPVETAITLGANKWNWIGYTPQFSLPVSEALAGITAPVLNDQVKGQKGYRIMSSNGWVGSLNTMEPGRGYKYRSGNSQQVAFYYPDMSAMTKSSPADEGYAYETYWTADYTAFDNNMTVTASLFIDNIEVKEGMYEIAAFSGNECRGSIVMEYIDGFDHPFMGFLMVYGSNNEQIEFRIYDHATGEIREAEETLVFASDAIYGTPDELFVLTAKAPTGIGTIDGSLIAIYPNPVEKELFIRHGKGVLERVEVSDVSGKLLLMEENFSDASLDVSSLAKGTYLIGITTGGQKVVRKFIKK